MNLSKLLIIGFSFCLLQVANAKIFLYKNTLQDTHYEKTKISTISNKIHDFNIHNYVSNFIMHSLFPDKSKVTINDFRTFINNTSSNDLKNLLTNNKLYGNKDGEINGNEVLKIIKDMKADDIKRVIKKLIPDDDSNDIVNIDGLIQIIDCNSSDNVKNILCKVISNNDVKNFVKILPSDTLKEILISLLKDNSNPQATIESIMKKNNKKPTQNPIKNSSELLNTEECKKFESNISSFITELHDSDVIDNDKYYEVKEKIKSESENLTKRLNISEKDLKSNYDLQLAINLFANIKALKLAMPDTNISRVITEKNQDFFRTKVIGESINFYMLEEIILVSPIDNIEDIFVKKFKTNSSKKDFSLYAYALELIFNHSLVDEANTYGGIVFIKPNKSEEDLNKLFKKNNMFKIYDNNKVISNYHLWSEDNKYKLDNDKLDSTIENSYKLLNISNAKYRLQVPTIFTNNELKYVIPHKISEYETFIRKGGGQSKFGEQIEKNNEYKLVEQKDIDNIENTSDLLIAFSNCVHNYNKNELNTTKNIDRVKEFLKLLHVNEKLQNDKNLISVMLCHEGIYNDALFNIINGKIDINETKKLKTIGDVFIYTSKLLEKHTNFYKTLEQRKSEDKY